MDLSIILKGTTLLSFALASILYLLSFRQGESQEKFGTWAFVLLATGTCISLLSIARGWGVVRWSELSALYLTFSIGVLTGVAHIRFRAQLIGAFTAPLVTIIIFTHYLFAPNSPVADQNPSSTITLIHVSAAIVGQAFAICAFAVSVLYLMEQNLLKKKLLAHFPRRFTSIDKLDKLLMLSLWAGFIFITISLLTGALYFTKFDGVRLKFAWAMAVWMWYLGTLLARNVFNQSGRRLSQLAVGGFALLAISYFGMGFFRSIGGIE